MAGQQNSPSVWERALPTLRMKPLYTKDVSEIMMEKVAPAIERKCRVWATNEEEFTACRRYMVRRLVNQYFSMTRQLRENLEKQFNVEIDTDGLPTPSVSEKVRQDSRDYIQRKCGGITDRRQRLTCLINTYNTVSKSVIIGEFVGSLENQNSEYYMPPKSKSGTKPRFEKDEKELFEDAIGVGNEIKKNCEEFADNSAEKESDKKIAYTYCRLTQVFRSLPYNIPRRAELTISRLAKEEGLSTLYQELENETKNDLNQARQYFEEEMKSRMSYLDKANATEPPIPFITLRIVKRAMTSTIGNAIAKRTQFS